MCVTCEAMRRSVPSRPMRSISWSPVASNCRIAAPYWNPCVHSVHPREVYLPSMVKTGVPSESFQRFWRLAILGAEASKTLSAAAFREAGVSVVSMVIMGA